MSKKQRSYNDCTVGIFGEFLISPLEGIGPVNQVEVDVIQAQILERSPASGLNIVRMMFRVPKFARHEQFGPKMFETNILNQRKLILFLKPKQTWEF